MDQGILQGKLRRDRMTISRVAWLSADRQADTRAANIRLGRIQDWKTDMHAIKAVVRSHVPPAMVLAVILFWTMAPTSWLKYPWTIVIVGAVITLVIQGLEFVAERHEGWRLNKIEFATDLFYVVLSATAISWATRTLADDPLKGLKHSLGIHTEWAMQMPFLAQVALVIVLNEFGQYWMHRLMHSNPFFWSTHAPHHHLTQLNAMKGAVGNPLELFLISLSVIALFDLSEPAVFCGFGIMTVISTFAHANVRMDPPRWYGYFFTTIRNHSLHHSATYEDTRCNYGNSLILLDRIFGTYREGESAIVGQDERKRLSIYEQFVFPLRPLIAAIQQRRGQAVASAN